MFKFGIFLLGITLLTASPVQEIPTSFFSDNYSGLKEFVQGLLDGYNDSNVDLPSICLNSSQQSKLDEDFVAMMSALVRFDIEKFIKELETLNDDLADVAEDCGVTEIVQNLNKDIAKNGRLWIVVNVATHFVEIQADLLECLEHILAEKWYKAGEKMGEILKFAIPAAYNPDSLQIATPDEAIEFMKGLLKGLCKNPSNPGTCYTGLETIVENSEGLLKDLYDYTNGNDPRAIEQMYIDGLALFNSLVRLDLSDCQFDKLIRTIERLNLDQLMANYFKNVVNINAAFAALGGCYDDYNGCGEDIGMLFRMVIGWSL